MKNLLMLDELAAPLFSTEWGRRAGLGCIIIFALLLAITFFQAFFTWHTDIVIGKRNLIPAHSSVTEEMTGTIADIPNLHLFGQHKTIGQSSALPVTSLQLRLVGVIKAIPEKYSIVIISDGGQPGKVYRIGDMLPVGVTVYSISDEGVILENDGHLEKLPLQRTPLLFQGRPKPLLNDEN